MSLLDRIKAAATFMNPPPKTTAAKPALRPKHTSGLPAVPDVPATGGGVAVPGRRQTEKDMAELRGKDEPARKVYGNPFPTAHPFSPSKTVPRFDLGSLLALLAAAKIDPATEAEREQLRALQSRWETLAAEREKRSFDFLRREIKRQRQLLHQGDVDAFTPPAKLSEEILSQAKREKSALHFAMKNLTVEARETLRPAVSKIEDAAKKALAKQEKEERAAAEKWGLEGKFQPSPMLVTLADLSWCPGVILSRTSTGSPRQIARSFGIEI